MGDRRQVILSSIKHDRNDSIQVNSFFAGIGGFDLGFEKSGFKTFFQCEINDFCLDILRRHWRDVPKATDINVVKPEEIPDANVWCAGFPCQDVSVASGSTRAGLNGKRTGLFFRFSELVAQRKPKVVLLENVTGLLNSNEGRDFRVVLDTLLKLGYSVSWRTVNSRYFGVPQSRPRIYICGWLSEPSKAAYTLFEPVEGIKLPNARKGFMDPTGDELKGPIVPKVSFCLAATSGRHTGTDWSRTYVAYPKAVRRLTPVECEGIQGFPTNWTLPDTDKYGDTDDIDTHRYTALGNAVSVPVVHWIAERIKQTLTSETPFLPRASFFNDGDVIDASKYNVPAERTEKFLQNIEYLSQAHPEFSKQSARKIFYLPEYDNIDQQEKFEWPNAGHAWEDACVAGSVSSAPSMIIESQLIDVIEKGKVDERYFLSPNAAEGILRRVNRQNRKLFEPLYKALVYLAGLKKVEAEHEDREEEAS